MGSAMKAITANPVFFILLQRNRVQIGFFGHGLMKSRIKSGNLLYLRKQRTDCLNSVDKGCAVKGQQIHGIINLSHYIVINYNRFIKIFAAVAHTVADGRELIHIFQNCSEQNIKHRFNGRIVVRQRQIAALPVSRTKLPDQARGAVTDTFGQAFGDNRKINAVSLKKLKFESC